jgi:hypothetical protein
LTPAQGQWLSWENPTRTGSKIIKRSAGILLSACSLYLARNFFWRIVDNNAPGLMIVPNCIVRDLLRKSIWEVIYEH